MTSKTLLVLLALAVGGIAILLLSEESSSPHEGQRPHRRSLTSFFSLHDYDDPKTVTAHVPQTAPTTIDMSQTLPMYPLRDLSKFSGSRSTLTWMKREFSDASHCLDFKCTDDTSLCDNEFQTNYDSLDGTPPCCTHVLRDMLRLFDEQMAVLGLNYFVGFGTLLGLVRSGRVIPWTIDNDIVLESVNALRAVGELWNAGAKGLSFVYPMSNRKGTRGFPRICATSEFAGGRLRRWEIPTPLDENSKPILFQNRGFPYIDFYFGAEMDRDTWGREDLKCRHFMSDIFPTKRVPVYLGQFAVNFPANPKALLDRYYGLDWMTPKTDDSPHGVLKGTCDINYGLEDY